MTDVTLGIAGVRRWAALVYLATGGSVRRGNVGASNAFISTTISNKQ